MIETAITAKSVSCQALVKGTQNLFDYINELTTDQYQTDKEAFTDMPAASN